MATILPHFLVVIASSRRFSSVIDWCIGFLPRYFPILSERVIQLVEQLADRPDLVAGVHAIDLLDVAKPPGVFRDDPGQGRVHSPGSDHIVARDVLHLLQLVLGLKIPYRNDLDRVFLAVGDVDEHRSEVAHALAGADLGAQVVFVFLGKVRVVGVEDVARVRAIAVVAPAEQGRGFVEQKCLQAAQVIGYAVDVLFYVVVQDVFDFVLVEVHELVVPQQHPEPAVDLHAHVDGRQVLHLQHFAEGVGVAIEIRLAKHHVVQARPSHGLRAAALGRDEFTQQQVAFELRNCAVVRVGA